MPSLRGLIIDGVTGTGKSSTLAALAECASRPAWLARARVVTEEETLGEALSQELQNAALDDHARAWRLYAVLDRIDREGAETSWILERFHPTYAALLPAWTGIDEIDQRIAARHFALVLLRVPEQDLEARSLRRADHGEAWTAGDGRALRIGASGAERDRRIAAPTRSVRRAHALADARDRYVFA